MFSYLEDVRCKTVRLYAFSQLEQCFDCSLFPFPELHLNEDSEATTITLQWRTSNRTVKDN